MTVSHGSGVNNFQLIKLFCIEYFIIDPLLYLSDETIFLKLNLHMMKVKPFRQHFLPFCVDFSYVSQPCSSSELFSAIKYFFTKFFLSLLIHVVKPFS